MNNEQLQKKSHPVARVRNGISNPCNEILNGEPFNVKYALRACEILGFAQCEIFRIRGM